MYPQGVTDPTKAIILLLQPVICTLQQPSIFFIQAVLPDPVKYPSLLTE